MKNIKKFDDFIFESESRKPKLYNELVRPLKDLYSNLDEKTKESFKDLSDELFKNPKDITEVFTRKISKYKSIEELLKELKSFIKSLKRFNESLYDEQSSDINDDLKSNFRSWEQDHDNYEDTDKLSRMLANRHPEMNMDEIWQITCDWTGFQE